MITTQSRYFVISVLFLCVFKSCKCLNKNYGYVTHGANGFEVFSVDQSDHVPAFYLSKAVYDNQINTTGWAFLELHTSKDYEDEKQAYAAGYLEGYLTHDLIWMYWQNTMRDLCEGKEVACNQIERYIDKNERWINKMLDSMANTDAYWYQIKLYLVQLQGLADGYDEANVDSAQSLSYRSMLYINLQGDLEDLFQVVGEQKLLGSGHCSALIKLLPDGSDVYVAQDTWNSFQSMLRIQKKYVLNLKTVLGSKDKIIGHTMSFSSYPGQLQSGDDFYIVSSGLTVLETTIGNANEDLWKYCSPNGQVMEFVRTMVANRLASSGKTWTDIFRKYNSGSYNNQWMVVDYKRFKPARIRKLNVKPGLLWVLEQIPGTIEAQDMTNLLTNQGYWPSYNIPYFQNIFNMSGGLETVKKFGDWFTYDKNPRAQIFKRDQVKIRNMDDMYALMRYNDFKHDPLSVCNCTPPYSAENAIAARNDLNLANGTYPFGALGHRSHGATDAKITNFRMARTYQFLSVSGPPHNETRGLPPFRWSEVDFGATTPHVGHPDIWQFKPVTHSWEFPTE